MLFLTVGTQFGFDRLVRAVDEAIQGELVKDTVFSQIGPGGYVPRHMDYAISLEKQAFEDVLNSCEGVISHAGMGNIAMAMKLEKPLLVMPRLKRYGEVVNDHQVGTARKFEEFGHILAAYDSQELAEKIGLLKAFTPRPRVPNRQGVVNRILQYLDVINQNIS